MKKVPAIILLTYMAVSLSCVTFAWMSEPEPPTGSGAYIDYFYDPDNPDNANNNVLRIQSRAIGCTIYGYNETTNDYTTDLQTTSFAKSGLVPGKLVPIKFAFTNASDGVASIGLCAYNITTSNIDLFDYLIFGVNKQDVPVVQYQYTTVVGTYTYFQDARNNYSSATNSYSLTLIENIEIVPTQSSQTVDVYCYIMLAKGTPSFIVHEADPNDPTSTQTTSVLEDATFNLGNFRIIM